VCNRYARLDRDPEESARTNAYLTVSMTMRAGMFEENVGSSDLVSPGGRDITYRIKGTLGITGLFSFRVHIDGKGWHLDVDSAYPGGVVAPKGATVRCLRSYVNWVQTVVRQVGLYLLMGKWCRELLTVRKDLNGVTNGGTAVQKECKQYSYVTIR
jgi:hypothetical protein